MSAPKHSLLICDSLSIVDRAALEDFVHQILVSNFFFEPRNRILNEFANLIETSFHGRAFPVASLANNTCLPFEEATLLCILHRGNEHEFLHLLVDHCANGNSSPNTSSRAQLSNVLFGNNGRELRMQLNGFDLKVFLNDISILYHSLLFEDVNRLFGNNSIFKRTYLLVKAWMMIEFPRFAPAPAESIFSAESLFILVLSLFSRTPNLETPLHGLMHFLSEYSNLNWERFAVVYNGIIPRTSNNVDLLQDLVDSSPETLVMRQKLDVLVNYYRHRYSSPGESLDSLIGSSNDSSGAGSSSNSVCSTSSSNTCANFDIVGNIGIGNGLPIKEASSVQQNNVTLNSRDFVVVIDPIVRTNVNPQIGWNPLRLVFENVSTILQRAKEHLEQSLQQLALQQSLNAALCGRQPFNAAEVLFPGLYLRLKKYKIEGVKYDVDGANSLLQVSNEYFDNVAADAELFAANKFSQRAVANIMFYILSRQGKPQTILDAEKLLFEATNNAALMKLIKVNYQGLKRVLMGFPNMFRIEDEHSNNALIYLAFQTRRNVGTELDAGFDMNVTSGESLDSTFVKSLTLNDVGNVDSSKVLTPHVSMSSMSSGSGGDVVGVESNDEDYLFESSSENLNQLLTLDNAINGKLSVNTSHLISSASSTSTTASSVSVNCHFNRLLSLNSQLSGLTGLSGFGFGGQTVTGFVNSSASTPATNSPASVSSQGGWNAPDEIKLPNSAEISAAILTSASSQLGNKLPGQNSSNMRLGPVVSNFPNPGNNVLGYRGPISPNNATPIGSFNNPNGSGNYSRSNSGNNLLGGLPVSGPNSGHNSGNNSGSNSGQNTGNNSNNNSSNNLLAGLNNGSGNSSNASTSSNNSRITSASGATVVDPFTGAKVYNPVKPEVWVPGKFNGEKKPNPAPTSTPVNNPNGRQVQAGAALASSATSAPNSNSLHNNLSNAGSGPRLSRTSRLHNIPVRSVSGNVPASTSGNPNSASVAGPMLNSYGSEPIMVGNQMFDHNNGDSLSRRINSMNNMNGHFNSGVGSANNVGNFPNMNVGGMNMNNQMKMNMSPPNSSTSNNFGTYSSNSAGNMMSNRDFMLGSGGNRSLHTNSNNNSFYGLQDTANFEQGAQLDNNNGLNLGNNSTNYPQFQLGYDDSMSFFGGPSSRMADGNPSNDPYLAYNDNNNNNTHLPDFLREM